MIYSAGKAPHPGFKGNFRVFEAQDFVAEVTGFPRRLPARVRGLRGILERCSREAPEGRGS